MDDALAEGDVPDALSQPLCATRYWQIARDAFRITLPSGLAFHYRRGGGTRFSRPVAVSDEEVALYFNGTVRGAIAWLNGFIPLHASAVVVDGGVHAFTGVSGEGKSTLAAALGSAGYTVFCDDLLILRPVANRAPLALSGGVRLKLWQDALALADCAPSGAVRPGVGKFFVGERHARNDNALPLRRLYMLETLNRPDPRIAPITGGARIAAIRDAYFRFALGKALLDPAAYCRTTAQLADRIDLRRFGRSRDRAAFADGVAAIIADLRADAAPACAAG